MKPQASSSENTQNSGIPAELGIWIFILFDMSIFALYFWVFAWGKSNNPEMYSQGQASLNHFYGGFNTVVLLISSYFMASAVQAARKNELERFQNLIKLTMFGGLVFCVVKVFEYQEKLGNGIEIVSNEFYRNYFTFTGFHLFHVLFGLGFLTYLLMGIKNKEQTEAKIVHIEGVGLYWHMVDLLWVVLFSLIYLVP
jgi:nitric oxide reductase NorE protein